MYNFSGNLRLDLKVVGEMALVRVGPQFGLATRLDQMHRDSRAVAFAPDVAVDDEVHPQDLPDVPNPRGGPLNERGGCACDHAEASSAQPAQLGDHFLA